MRTPAILLALALAVGARPAHADARRDVLWAALKTCVVAKRTTGATFPCLAVDLGGVGQPGTAVLRAPGARTHVVVMPVDTVVGLEAPELQQERGAAYWRAALGARHFITDALQGARPIDDVGLAINSAGGRSQDQLHIHLDCVKPGVRATVEKYGQTLGPSWKPLPVALHGARYFAMRVGGDAVERFNPFAALTRLPGHRRDLQGTSFAAFSTARAGAPGSVVLLAYRGPSASAEALLDHSCQEPGSGASAHR